MIMIKKADLDKRICDCEEGAANTQTYREFIRECEKNFETEADFENMSDEELNEYFNFLDYLCDK